MTPLVSVKACAKCDQPRSPVGVGESTAPGSSRLDQSDPSTISQMTRYSPAALASCSACRIFSALSGSSSSIVTNRILCCLPACSSLLSLASRFIAHRPTAGSECPGLPGQACQGHSHTGVTAGQPDHRQDRDMVREWFVSREKCATIRRFGTWNRWSWGSFIDFKARLTGF